MAARTIYRQMLVRGMVCLLGLRFVWGLRSTPAGAGQFTQGGAWIVTCSGACIFRRCHHSYTDPKHYSNRNPHRIGFCYADTQRLDYPICYPDPLEYTNYFHLDPLWVSLFHSDTYGHSHPDLILHAIPKRDLNLSYPNFHP